MRDKDNRPTHQNKRLRYDITEEFDRISGRLYRDQQLWLFLHQWIQHQMLKIHGLGCPGTRVRFTQPSPHIFLHLCIWYNITIPFIRLVFFRLQFAFGPKLGITASKTALSLSGFRWSLSAAALPDIDFDARCNGGVSADTARIRVDCHGKGRWISTTC